MPKAKSREIEDKNAELVAQIIDLYYEMIKDMEKLINLKKEIEKTINTLDNEQDKLLLTKRYIDGKKWERIAYEMDYSWQHMHRLHKKALDLLKM